MSVAGCSASTTHPIAPNDPVHPVDAGFETDAMNEAFDAQPEMDFDAESEEKRVVPNALPIDQASGFGVPLEPNETLQAVTPEGQA